MTTAPPEDRIRISSATASFEIDGRFATSRAASVTGHRTPSTVTWTDGSKVQNDQVSPGTAASEILAGDGQDHLVGCLEDETLAQCQPRQKPEIAEIVVGATAERSQHDQVCDSELVEGILQRLVEIGPILVGSINHDFFAEPAAGLRADGIEVTDHRCRP